MKILNQKPKILNRNRGFTLIELVLVIAILSILAGIFITSFISAQKRSELDNSSQQIIAILKLAQNKTLASEQNSQYGVSFNTAASPHQYILFKGVNYVSRETSYDQVYSLPKTLGFFGVSLDGGSEVVFEKLTGTAKQSGNITLRLKTDISQSKTIYISNSGTVGFVAPTTITDTRVKDSRHLHFNYSRIIDTNNENLILTFDSSVTKTIPIKTSLVAGQFQWSGTVAVGSENQTIDIRTHRLNNPDSQFSIYRDRRFNSKTLKVKISADGSGSLAEYSADGLTVNGLTIVDCSTGATGLSIYVSNCKWQ